MSAGQKALDTYSRLGGELSYDQREFHCLCSHRQGLHPHPEIRPQLVAMIGTICLDCDCPEFRKCQAWGRDAVTDQNGDYCGSCAELLEKWGILPPICDTPQEALSKSKSFKSESIA